MVRALVNNPFAVFQTDRSVGARVLSIIVAVFALFESPFGSGIGSFTEASFFLANKYNLYSIALGSDTGRIGGLSMLSIYAVELGIVWVLFIMYIFRAVLNKMGLELCHICFCHFILFSLHSR